MSDYDQSFCCAAPCPYCIRVESSRVDVSTTSICEAVLYSVFLIFSGLTTDDAYFYDSVVTFSKASIYCKQSNTHHTEKTASGYTFIFSGLSIFYHGTQVPNRVINSFFSFLDWSFYVYCIYMCIYKLSYIQRKEVFMNLHRAHPWIKVKMSIMKDEGEAIMTDPETPWRFYINSLQAASGPHHCKSSACQPYPLCVATAGPSCWGSESHINAFHTEMKESQGNSSPCAMSSVFMFWSV